MGIRRRTAGMITATSIAVAAGFVVAPNVATAAPAALREATLLSSTTLPDSFMQIPGFRWGGISGLDSDGRGNFVAISDDKGDYGPARYYNFRMDGRATPRITGVGTVAGQNNLPLAPGTFDLEAVRRVGGNLLVSSEGLVSKGVAPFLRIVRPPTGLPVRDLPIPAAYRPNTKQDWGFRDNLGFEGVAVSGQTVSAVSETALAQDGPEPGRGTSSSARFLQMNLAGKVTGEFVYRIDGLSPDASNEASKGVSELLALSPTEFLVIERGFDPKTKRNDVKLYQTTTRGAQPVTGAEKLSGGERAMPKRLIFDFADQRENPDNVEAMAWGRRLPDGRRTLVLISDDNFNTPTQHTRIHILAVR